MGLGVKGLGGLVFRLFYGLLFRMLGERLQCDLDLLVRAYRI